MKKLFLLSVFCIYALSGYSQTLEVTFNTKPQPGARFEEEYVLAAWVEDAQGNFVSSLLVYGSKYRRYLKKWEASSSKSTVNAVTGATIESNQTHKLIWNCRKADGSLVSRGDYKLCVEMTGNNAAGPYSEVPFALGLWKSSSKPVDGQNFTGLTFSYKPRGK